jgi:ribosomal protein S18 acetylase RimI-like enzyme
VATLRMPMTFRPAILSDIERLHALVESAYRGDSAKQGWTHEAEMLSGQRLDQTMLADMLHDPQQSLVVAEGGDGIVGCVSVTRKGDHAYLGLLTVAPHLQGQGIGKKLTSAAEDVVRGWDLKRIEMRVIRHRHELIAWYEKLGYVITGETRPFPMDDRRFGVPLRNDLEFIVLEKILA